MELAYHDHAFKAPTTGCMIASVATAKTVSEENVWEVYFPSESMEDIECRQKLDAVIAQMTRRSAFW
jgi:hypothetical protein